MYNAVRACTGRAARCEIYLNEIMPLHINEETRDVRAQDLCDEVAVSLFQHEI